MFYHHFGTGLRLYFVRDVDITVDDLSQSIKAKVTAELRVYVNQLHRIPAQDDYQELGRGSYIDETFMSIEYDCQKRICGPPEAGSQVVEAIVQRYVEPPTRREVITLAEFC